MVTQHHWYEWVEALAIKAIDVGLDAHLLISI